MKLTLITTACLLLTMLVSVSCGKKAKSKEGERNSLQYVADDDLSIRKLAEAAHDNDFETFRQIMEENPRINVNKPTRERDTLLTISIRKNSRRIFQYLLTERLTDLEQPTYLLEDFGMTPLIVASAYGHYHLVKDLLDRGVAVNKTDGRSSALHYSIKRKFDNITILLLKYNANVEHKDEFKKSAFTLAREFGSPEIINYIWGISEAAEGMIPDEAALSSIIKVGNKETLEKILRRHPKILKENEQINPLALALEIPDDNQSFLIMKIMMEYGLDLNGPRDATVRPLIEAVKKNRLLIAELLLQRGANVNMFDNTKRNALHYAIRDNNYDMVDLLLAFSADYNLKQVCKDVYTIQQGFPMEDSQFNNRNVRKRLGCR